MDSFNSESGRKVAEAIDRRVMNVAKNIYENSPNNKTKFGTVLSSDAGLFNVKIDNVTYKNIPALRNVGSIKRGEVVICLVPNNQYSNMVILGVADGTLQDGGSGETYSKVYVSGEFVETFDADTKANVADLNKEISDRENADNTLQTNINNVNQRVDNILLNCWPVNSVYISIVNTSPASLFGGTWEALPEGYALWTTTTNITNESEGKDTDTIKYRQIPAGLPNLYGNMQEVIWRKDNASYGGVFASSTRLGDYWDTNAGHSYQGARWQVVFNAAGYNAIYGNSNTVQSPAYKLFAWKRIS